MITEFTIDRKKWLIPENTPEYSCLLSESGNMCCLGFFAKQSGVKNDKLLEIGTPEAVSIKNKRELFGKLLLKNLTDSNICKRLMYINDCRVGSSVPALKKEVVIKSLEHREELIKKEFAKIGVNVKFKGKYINEQKS